MNRETFVTDTHAITKLAAAIFAADGGAAQGRSTYLRSLLAGTQAELAGKPVLRVSGRPKRPELVAAAAAFEKVNTAFYEAVLAAVPDGLTPAERQSRTSFARSAAASLRRAIKTGWNPLAQGVAALTKGTLTAWIKEHAEPRPVTAGAAEKRVVRMVERITELLEQLPQDEAARIRAIAAANITPDIAPQRIVSARLTRQDRPRAAPH